MSARAVMPEKYPWYDYSTYSFSLGIAAGDGVYLSGHTASEYDGDIGRIRISGGMTAQARTAYAKISAILEAAGRTHDDVVRVVEYIKPEGIERYGEAAAVRKEVFGGCSPTVNTVPVRALLRPDALIEVEVTAGLGDGNRPSGMVFLPTIQPVDGQGSIIAPGDVAAQTEAVFETARGLLTALGLGLSHVVKTLDYITPAALAGYRDKGRVRRNYLGPVYPCAAGIIMPRLLHGQALIQCDFIAAREDPVAVNPGWERYEKLTYSPGVLAGKHLFLSGQGAINPDTGEMEHVGDLVAQAEYVYGNIFKVIAAAASKPENLVKTIEYVTPDALARYREVGALRTRQLARPYPAATGLICQRLPRADMLIAVDPFAVLD